VPFLQVELEHHDASASGRHDSDDNCQCVQWPAVGLRVGLRLEAAGGAPHRLSTASGTGSASGGVKLEVFLQVIMMVVQLGGRITNSKSGAWHSPLLVAEGRPGAELEAHTF